MITDEQRAELAGLVREMIRPRGDRVGDWPEDESAAYRDNDGFEEGQAAVEALRIEKGVAAIADVIAAALRETEDQRDEARRIIARQERYIEGLEAADVLGLTAERDALARQIETVRDVLDATRPQYSPLGVECPETASGLHARVAAALDGEDGA